jgi:hypothetical protein
VDQTSRESWLQVGIDSLSSKIATNVPLNVVNGEGSGVNETVEFRFNEKIIFEIQFVLIKIFTKQVNIKGR